jgi:UDP-glucose 4-epimerase
MQSVSWIIGRGGLLGQNVERAVARTAKVWSPDEALAWTERKVVGQLARGVDRFAERAGGAPWCVAWCAGAGVVSATEETLAVETHRLESLLGALGARVRDDSLGPGVLFFASSAGGLYAGSSGPPFDEATEPCPISPYGHHKLLQERIVRSWSEEHGIAVLIARIANLYGPGQNLSKPQGLISQLCWSQLKHVPLRIYVPLGTTRDYLYAPDCATMITRALGSLEGNGDRAPLVTVKVMASRRPMSIGAVIGEFRRVLRRNPRMSHQASPQGRHQVLDLRLTSRTTIGELGSDLTPFAVGLHSTFEDLRRRCAAS